MRDLMATYPSELSDRVDLNMDDPTLSELANIVKGFKGILIGHTVMSRALLEANAERMKTFSAPALRAMSIRRTAKISVSPCGISPVMATEALRNMRLRY